jgi:flagellar basal body-associated protein FliL
MADEEIVIIEGEDEEEKVGSKSPDESGDSKFGSEQKSKDKIVILLVALFLLILVSVVAILALFTREPEVNVVDFWISSRFI